MDRPADPLYTLRVQLVHESSFIQSKSDLFPTLNWINRGGAQSLIIFFHSHIFDLRNHSYLRSGSITDKLDEKVYLSLSVISVTQYRIWSLGRTVITMAEFQLRNLTRVRFLDGRCRRIDPTKTGRLVVVVDTKEDIELSINRRKKRQNF